MKFKTILMMGSMLILGAATARGADWKPSPTSGGHVRWVSVDDRSDPSWPSPTKLAVVFNEDPNTQFTYYFNSSNATEAARANRFLSALLSAKASGEPTQILWGTNATWASSNSILAIQVGPN